jgi:hypothetical protein
MSVPFTIAISAFNTHAKGSAGKVTLPSFHRPLLSVAKQHNALFRRWLLLNGLPSKRFI